MSDIGYVPLPVPSVEDDELIGVLEWLERELEQIAGQFQENSMLRLTVLHVVPDKPRNGMMVYADGSNWNPGSGEGFYGYEGGAWVKL